MIEFACSGCGKVFRVDDALAGKQAKCRACGHRLTVPPLPFDDDAMGALDLPALEDSSHASFADDDDKRNADSMTPAVSHARTPLVLHGRMGKSVVVRGSTVKIIKKAWAMAAQREKTLPIRNISSVEVKKPGLLVVGFIQFSIAGGHARDSSFTATGGAFGAVQDENSVVFAENDSYAMALKIKEYVDTYTEPTAAATNQSSVADDIAKFKALMDQGVISEADFERKKRQLLDM